MNKYEENVAEGWKKMINMVEKWSECIVYIFCFPSFVVGLVSKLFRRS